MSSPRKSVSPTRTASPSKSKPDAPRKPLTAYFLFARDNRAEILREYPTAKVTEIARLNAQAWANLSDDDKEIYEEEAEQVKEDYDRSISKQTVHSTKPVSPGKSGRIGKSKRDPDAPKKPLTAYFVFAQKNRASILRKHPNAGVTEVARLNAQAWANLSKDEKNSYIEEAAQLEEAYDETYEAYEDAKAGY